MNEECAARVVARSKQRAAESRRVCHICVLSEDLSPVAVNRDKCLSRSCVEVREQSRAAEHEHSSVNMLTLTCFVCLFFSVWLFFVQAVLHSFVVRCRAAHACIPFESLECRY
jgi:hypothetical protein